VVKPHESGFGRIMTERLAATALDSRVDVDYAAQGLRWSIELSPSNLADGAG
jgi:hypothetical protein